MTSQAFVIVGAGLAGGKAAEALRGGGFDGQITTLEMSPVANGVRLVQPSLEFVVQVRN